MTVVIAIQGLVATLAGLLLLEARMRRQDHDERETFDAVQAAEIVFHPELIVAWDDEANDARRRPCSRSVTVDKHESRRPQLASSRTHMRLR